MIVWYLIISAYIGYWNHLWILQAKLSESFRISMSGRSVTQKISFEKLSHVRGKLVSLVRCRQDMNGKSIVLCLQLILALNIRRDNRPRAFMTGSSSVNVWGDMVTSSLSQTSFQQYFRTVEPLDWIFSIRQRFRDLRLFVNLPYAVLYFEVILVKY